MENIKTLLTNIKENKLLLISIVALALFSFIIIALATGSFVSDKGGKYVDPLSGETVLDPKDRTPETFNQANQVTYLGFTELISRGVSFENMQFFKEELKTIAISGESVSEVSVDVESVEHAMDSENDIYAFNIRFNRKNTFKVTLNIKKVSNSLTYKFSGNGVENISFNN